VSHAIQIGDRPQMDKLIGTIKVMLDSYTKRSLRPLVIGYTRFLNTMKQEPVMEQLLPLAGERLGRAGDGLGLPLRAGSQGRCSTR
jgi:F-type H+-transporting ATPase subunit gamma